MAARVVFYQLTHKFVSREADIPPGARQVIYYSLAIGHHVGVLDCLQPVAEAPQADFDRWVAALPEGAARRKLAGVRKWGEIEINHTHAADLRRALEGAGEAAWTGALARCLEAMAGEPALYLMARQRA
jgi:hypothetical protein